MNRIKLAAAVSIAAMATGCAGVVPRETAQVRVQAPDRGVELRNGVGPVDLTLRAKQGAALVGGAPLIAGASVFYVPTPAAAYLLGVGLVGAVAGAAGGTLIGAIQNASADTSEPARKLREEVERSGLADAVRENLRHEALRDCFRAQIERGGLGWPRGSASLEVEWASVEVVGLRPVAEGRIAIRSSASYVYRPKNLPSSKRGEVTVQTPYRPLVEWTAEEGGSAKHAIASACAVLADLALNEIDRERAPRATRDE